MLTSLSNLANPAMVSPALTVMRSIIDTQDEAAKTLNRSPFDLNGELETGSSKPKLSTEALNQIYFGDHVSITEAKIKLISYVNRYVASAIDAQTSHEAQGGEGPAGSSVTAKLVENLDFEERTSLRQSLQTDISDMDSAIKTATRISLSFNLDRLSADRDMMKYLEQMMGMKLDGLSVADIIKSFLDPDGKSAGKVNSVISKGLAGQTGSKVMQRLEDAAAGPKTVAEAKKDAVEKSDFEEVDDETKAEDKSDIDTARAMETLGRVIAGQDTVDGKELDDATTAAGEKLQAKLDAIRVKTDTTPDAQPGDDEPEINEANEAYLEFMLEMAGGTPKDDQPARYF